MNANSVQYLNLIKAGLPFKNLLELVEEKQETLHSSCLPSEYEPEILTSTPRVALHADVASIVVSGNQLQI
jgi:hypothetical protein